MSISDLLIAEVKRRLLEENIPRIRKCLDLLSDAEIWYRHNESTVSIGNLILHLNGNVRQWLIGALGKQAFQRQRQAEFDETGPLPKSELITVLNNLEADIASTLNNIDAAALQQEYQVQGYTENGVSILVHVIEHFSYHTGQISLLTKQAKNTDLGYYAGHDLNKS